MEFNDFGGRFTISLDNRALLDRLQTVLARQAKEKFDIKLLPREDLFIDDNGELFIWDRTSPYYESSKPAPEAQKWFEERLLVLKETLLDAN